MLVEEAGNEGPRPGRGQRMQGRWFEMIVKQLLGDFADVEIYESIKKWLCLFHTFNVRPIRSFFLLI